MTGVKGLVKASATPKLVVVRQQSGGYQELNTFSYPSKPNI
ncbi:hypothetical protein [Legionella wadsworthii]|nr:hypothetical protein [Legionella wadsworthii]